ncbi:S-methyl-5-thioribose kinase [Acuticoccus sp. M5D2P5]|uniref:S-methyl-5-thioribose kinase n=1 Tax=Acuticoccus kalidii TaxID=2910977 RepID=UPI001F306374|nr:S-methyl-5-thioribose kinase [Acuticoccus kalidii]MCF3934616.1 S-methyl-5-thioribose kinase [Acuticoccus kalidii]
MDGVEIARSRHDRRSADSVPDYSDYVPLSLETVPPRLAHYDGIAARLGGTPDDWSVREVGDGNLNFVYIVEGPAGSVCVKQALPYVRLVGESWPLPLARSFYEYSALVRQAERSGHVPEILHFDGPQALVVMENLAPHIIWRKALMARERHETAAPIMGRFLAETLFRSSDLSLSAETKKREIALFSGNTALCKITEDLVFTDPYRDHPLNRWTSPELDATVAAIRADAEWKIAIQELKYMFLTRAEALVHGDAHTGSVMVAKAATGEDIRVIDPEFAFYGPMGFDLGAAIANLFLSYYSQDGRGPDPGPYQAWLLTAIARLWDTFASRFAELWRTERTGDAYPPTLYEAQDQTDASEAALARFLVRLEADTLGFAGAKMARRILGLAGVADLETIEPATVRAGCERRALALARRLVVDRERIGSVACAIVEAKGILGEVK